MYAGIKAIPDEVLEAARAGRRVVAWQHRRRGRSLPMLRPLLMIVMIQSIIWDFKVFTQIYVMTNGGGIAGQNLVLNVYAYQKAFAGAEYGLGSAIGVVMTLMLLSVTAALPAGAATRRGRAHVSADPRPARVPRPGRLIAEIVAVVVAGIVAFPLYWMVLSALKPAGEIQSANPRPWTLAPDAGQLRAGARRSAASAGTS